MTCKVTDTTVYPVHIPTKADFNQTLLMRKGDYDPKLIGIKPRKNHSSKPYTKNGGYE